MIRKIIASDKEQYIKMVNEFYSSEAVHAPIPDINALNTFDELIKSDIYAECYIFEIENIIAGYGLLAKTFSQEAGGIVIWIDEIFVKQEFRSCGIGKEFFSFIEKKFANNVKRIRLEVEEGNKRAVSLYEKIGFSPLEYNQMIKEYK